MRVIRSKGILRRGVSREDAISQLREMRAETEARLKEVEAGPDSELKIVVKRELLTEIRRIDGRINVLEKAKESSLHSS